MCTTSVACWLFHSVVSLRSLSYFVGLRLTVILSPECTIVHFNEGVLGLGFSFVISYAQGSLLCYSRRLNWPSGFFCGFGVLPFRRGRMWSLCCIIVAVVSVSVFRRPVASRPRVASLESISGCVKQVREIRFLQFSWAFCRSVVPGARTDARLLKRYGYAISIAHLNTPSPRSHRWTGIA